MTIEYRGRTWNLEKPRRKAKNPSTLICRHLGKLTKQIPCCPGQPFRDYHECSLLGSEVSDIECSKCALHTALTASARITVAVLCHNYGRFLKDCVDSVKAQTLQAEELFVVDVGSTEPIESDVPILRLDSTDLWEAKQFVVDNTKSPYVLFVDADNTLSPDFLEKSLGTLVAARRKDSSVAFAYPQIHKFGESTEKLLLKDSVRGADLQGTNYCDASSLFLRSAWRTVDPVRGHEMTSAQLKATWEDRAIWTQFLSAGFKGAASEAVLNYRVHGTNASKAYGRQDSYTEMFCANELVQIICPMAGRAKAWSRQRREFWNKLDRDKSYPTILLTSSNAAFNEEIKEYFFDWPQATVVMMPTPELADKPRAEVEFEVQTVMCRIWTKAASLAHRGYVLTLEDDILLPSCWREELFRALGKGIDYASAPYLQRHGYSHYTHWYGKWSFANMGQERRSGVEKVNGTGFGAMLLHGDTLKRTPFIAEPLDGSIYYDPVWFANSRLNGVIVWNAEAEHFAER